jgi:RecA/RadA recombinase
MATVTLVEETEAPAPPKPISPMTEVSLEVLRGLKKGRVAEIVLEEGDMPKSVTMSLYYNARQQGKKITVWLVDDVVYAKLA